MSATSSRYSVPPSAVSRRPGRTSLPSASSPNSSSSKRSGVIRAELTMTKALSARGLQLWSSRAATSLPAPAGPVTRTRLPVLATRFSVARTALITAELPVNSSPCPWFSRSRVFSRRSRSVSVARSTRCSSRSASNGFSMKSTAPRLTALTAVSMFPWPEKMMTGRSGSRTLIASSTSSPSIWLPCSHTSSNTRLGRFWSMASSAAVLSAAVRHS